MDAKSATARAAASLFRPVREGGDGGVAVLRGGEDPNVLGRLADALGRDEEVVEVAEAVAREDALPAHVAEAAPEKGQKLDLEIAARGVVGVTSFGGARHEAVAVPDEDRLAETGACRDDRDVGPALLRRAGPEPMQLRRAARRARPATTRRDR